MLNNTHGSGSQPEQQALSQSYNHRLKVTDSETHTQQTDFYSDEEEAWVSPVPRAVLVLIHFVLFLAPGQGSLADQQVSQLNKLLELQSSHKQVPYSYLPPN